MSRVAGKCSLRFGCVWQRPVRVVQRAPSFYVLDQHFVLGFLAQSRPLAVATLLLRLFGDAVQYLAEGDISDGIRELGEARRGVSFG